MVNQTKTFYIHTGYLLTKLTIRLEGVSAVLVILKSSFVWNIKFAKFAHQPRLFDVRLVLGVNVLIIVEVVEEARFAILTSKEPGTIE